MKCPLYSPTPTAKPARRPAVLWLSKGLSRLSGSIRASLIAPPTHSICPGFRLTRAFAELKHFRQRVNALALPAIEITPADPLIGTNPPAFGFTVKTPLDRLDRLACYHPQFDSVMVERLGAQRFEVRFPGPFKRGRSRLNCTVPGPDNRYHWFGWQFYVGGTR